MSKQTSVLEAADHLRTTTLLAVQKLARDIDGGMIELRDAVQSEVKNNPVRAVLVAAGIGYVLGGGLAAPVTRRLTRLAMRALLLPLLDQPTARLWDWIPVGCPFWRRRERAAPPMTPSKTLGKPQSEGEKTMTMNDLKHISKDDILAALGLETRHSMSDHMLSGLLMLGMGIAVGVGIGMLLAPKSGDQLREDLSNRYRKTVGMAHDAVTTDQSSSRSGTTTSATGMGSAGSASHKTV